MGKWLGKETRPSAWLGWEPNKLKKKTLFLAVSFKSTWYVFVVQTSEHCWFRLILLFRSKLEVATNKLILLFGWPNEGTFSFFFFWARYFFFFLMNNSLFGLKKMVTHHSVLITHHSSLSFHYSSLITHHLKHPILFGIITHLSSLNIFQLFVGPILVPCVAFTFFFFFLQPSIAKFTEPSEKKK